MYSSQDCSSHEKQSNPDWNHSQSAVASDNQSNTQAAAPSQPTVTTRTGSGYDSPAIARRPAMASQTNGSAAQAWRKRTFLLPAHRQEEPPLRLQEDHDPRSFEPESSLQTVRRRLEQFQFQSHAAGGAVSIPSSSYPAGWRGGPVPDPIPDPRGFEFMFQFQSNWWLEAGSNSSSRSSSGSNAMVQVIIIYYYILYTCCFSSGGRGFQFMLHFQLRLERSSIAQ